MDLISNDQLKSLVETKKEPSVSIFIPTFRKGNETEQNSIRYKNLYRKAEDILASSYDFRRDHLNQFLQHARDLIEDYDFWEHQSNGLAVFISKDDFYTFRLPFSFKEIVYVGDRFLLKPILPILSNEGRFYILALSQNNIRIFQCTKYTISEVELDEELSSLKEALKEIRFEKELQFHTRQPRMPSSAGRRRAGFFGTGASDIDEKKLILNHFHKLDKGLHEFLKDEGVPLVFAGVDYLFPIYKEANTYSHLFPVSISGNPDSMSEKDLRDKAWSLVEPHFKKGQKEAIEKYEELSGKNSELCSSDLEDILKASFQSRVDLIFVPFGIQIWGSFKPNELEIELHDKKKHGSEDLLDLAAVYTYLNGGNVFVLDKEKIPVDSEIAAVYRF